jgi:predicted 2-oxoglutarate/Fe(II)-dependent dioxygenase YbiX
MEFKRFKKVIPDFFTKEECVGFVNFAEKEGFEEALVNTRAKGQVMMKEMRDNDRHVWQARDLATQLWPLLKEHIPQDVDGWRPIGLNEQFRIYRYKDGQQFKTHPDGAFKRNDHEHSKITVIVYLNDDFEGGETEFVMPHEIIEPKAGTLLLFAHGQLHKGNPVPKGTKYVFRTDVMYTDIPPRPSELMPNIYDLIADMDFEKDAATVREAIRRHQIQGLEGEDLTKATNQVAYFLVQRFYGTLLEKLDKEAEEND